MRRACALVPADPGMALLRPLTRFDYERAFPRRSGGFPDRSFRNFVPGSDSRRRDLPASGPGVDATNVDCGRSTRSRETAGWRRFSRQVGP